MYTRNSKTCARIIRIDNLVSNQGRKHILCTFVKPRGMKACGTNHSTAHDLLNAILAITCRIHLVPGPALRHLIHSTLEQKLLQHAKRPRPIRHNNKIKNNINNAFPVPGPTSHTARLHTILPPTIHGGFFGHSSFAMIGRRAASRLTTVTFRLISGG